MKSPMFTLAQAHALVPGSTLIGEGNIELVRVHSDTRSLRAGDLFVALKGERFDAHSFLAQAKAAGALAAIAEHGLVEAGLSGLQVADSERALQALAAAWRRRFHLPLIAVTGSNGKTTVTQMIASILREWHGDGAFATEGNFNNHIGVPLTLLRLRQDDSLWHRAGVVELGMNHAGEIAQLARIAQPTIALVNNAQREHQEFMAGVEAVAHENGAAIEALGASGVAVYPASDAYAPLWQRIAAGRPHLTFRLNDSAVHGPGDADGAGSTVQTLHAEPPAKVRADLPADLSADAHWAGDHWAMVLHTPAGAVSLSLRMAGRHNLHNALAAAACALAAGAPLAAIQRGLEAFEPVKGRSRVLQVRLQGRAATLVDDSYNANPDSVRAAVELLATLPTPRLLLLGDMGEVGTQGPEFHTEVGAFAKAHGIDTLWAAGPLCAHAAAAFKGARHFESTEAMLAALPELPPCASLLVKGSRFMKMERVVQTLSSQQHEAS